MKKKHKIIIAGAAPDTGNLGVSALLTSMIASVSNYENELIILDHGNGLREIEFGFNKVAKKVTLCGARHGKRIYQSENLSNIRVSSRICAGRFNLIAKEILSADVMLDISGGDSFTDLYGKWRYRAITLPKIIAIENKIPLILMPQTYGPYLTSAAKESAAVIVKKAAMAFARDGESYQVLKDLLGNKFNPEIHIQGVDVAFLLTSIKPTFTVPNTFIKWVEDPIVQTVGINISGLIYNQLPKSYSQYGFKANYQEVIYQLIKKFVEETSVNIVLVPHVLVDKINYESDFSACEKVIKLFSENDKKRIEIISDNYSPSEMKWIISQVDWFCGTRMHSTIAGLSSCVPTAAISYSIKTKRVFKTCKQESQVIDPRELGTVAVVDGLWRCWLKRDEVYISLKKVIPSVIEKAEKQMNLIRDKLESI